MSSRINVRTAEITSDPINPIPLEKKKNKSFPCLNVNSGGPQSFHGNGVSALAFRFICRDYRSTGPPASACIERMTHSKS
jgi:hypothetical protein